MLKYRRRNHPHLWIDCLCSNRKILEGNYYSSVDMVFLLVGPFVKRGTSHSEDDYIKDMNTRYSDILTKLCDFGRSTDGQRMIFKNLKENILLQKRSARKVRPSLSQWATYFKIPSNASSLWWSPQGLQHDSHRCLSFGALQCTRAGTVTFQMYENDKKNGGISTRDGTIS